MPHSAHSTCIGLTPPVQKRTSRRGVGATRQFHVLRSTGPHRGVVPDPGARRLHDDVRSLGETHWVTLVDPEDNEFCVCTGVEW
jgi:hypothetical protein